MKKKKLRPCDCQDEYTAQCLNEQGIGFNDQSIMLHPNSVILTLGNTTVKIGMQRFKQFAEWFLTEQDVESTGTFVKNKNLDTTTNL
jgi:hypothetical protein